jgi:hypothetical protein
MFGVVTVAITLLAGLACAGQPTMGPNWGQTDTFGLTLESGWDCEPGDAPPGGDFHTIPGLALSLTTSGNPVQVTFTMNVRGGQSAASPGSNLRFRPVIDGTPMADDLQGWQLQNNVSMVDSVTYMRIFPLRAGPHTIAAEAACQGVTVVFRSWVSAYELPTMRP